MISHIFPGGECFGAEGISEELLRLSVGHIEGETDGPLPVFTYRLQHLQAVHAELGDERHVVRQRRVVVVDVVQVSAMLQVAFAAPVVTLVILIQRFQLEWKYSGNCQVEHLDCAPQDIQNFKKYKYININHYGLHTVMF